MQNEVQDGDVIVSHKIVADTKVVRQVALTEGELLPWKGFWWKAHLNETTRTVELHRQRPTATTEKLTARAMRWRKQHPNAMSGLRPGSASGLQVQQQALPSTESQKSQVSGE